MYLRTNKVSDWKQINYRNVDSMLSVQFIYDLYDQYSSTINWFRFKNVCLYYQNNKLWSYTPADEWENVLNNIAKQFINPKQNSNPDIIKKCYWYYNRKESLLEKFLKKHSNTNLSKLTDSELYNLLFNWYQITINQIYFINLAPVELGLQRAISKLNENKYLNPDEVSILYSLDNNTAVIKEEYAFLKKVYNNKTQNKDELIEEHVKEFGYVTIGYGSKPLDKKLLYARYDKIINMDRKCVENRIKEIENYPKFIKNQKAKVYNKLNNDQLAQLFDLAAKLGYMRDRKKAYLGKSVEYRNILFEEISKRKEINIEDIKYYIMEDFSNLLINGMALSNEEIDERKKGVYISNVTNMYSGEYARENYFSSVKTDKEDINILNVRKGVCASPGVVRGKARVCLSFEESNNLKTGEILVTYGTDFDFMNAIVKSAGIITEEGGILSHASVISRELKKPCIIAFKGITKVIKTGDLIELNAENGEVISVIGPSGCGKSTLLRCINMLEKPSSGKIIFEGIDITSKNTDLPKVREKIGMVFQQFNLFPHLTVLDNIILAPVKLGIMDKNSAVERAEELLKETSLLDKKDNYPEELSGGQKQRVAIVRSLIMNPDIILFDEPTSALDPEMVGDVLELIKKVADTGMTMIVVSHEMNFVKKCSSRVLFIDNGKIALDGTPKEVFSNKDNERLREFLNKTNN